jgi:phosphate butyryltransferase
MNAPAEGLRNRTWDDLAVGDEASIEKTVSSRDLYLFAHASGNLNPLHMPTFDPDHDGISDAVAPSMWIGALISNVLGNVLPGPGTLYRHQSFDFVDRAHVGDQIAITVRLLEKLEKPYVVFETVVTKVGGPIIASGKAMVSAPKEHVTLSHHELPPLLLEEHDHFAKLIEAAKKLEPLQTAVVCPDDANSLKGTLLAMRQGLIVPILIGDKAKIEEAAREAHEDLSLIQIIDVSNHTAAAAKAVELVHTGQVRAIMKGNLHSDELLGQVVKREGGLRTSRRISHVFAMNVPTLDHPLFITDAAINIAPDLLTKVDITQNAIDLAQACGIDQPLVAIMSAVETINVNIPSSMEAAILAKMADRGQITGGIVDGPLAMDNAIDMGAAATKKLVSPVAGRAQVLVVPNLESGNMLAKQLTFVSHAQPAGLVLGAKIPVMLTSRADNEAARLASCALAQLYDAFRRNKKSVFH